jgi:hypothetical protein
LTADVTKPARRLWPPNVEGSKPETRGALLDDCRDVSRRQAPVSDALGAPIEDPAEDRSLSDAGRVQPRSEGCHGARYLASGDRNPPTEPRFAPDCRADSKLWSNRRHLDRENGHRVFAVFIARV